MRDRPAAAEYRSDLARAHYELAKLHRSTGRPPTAQAQRRTRATCWRPWSTTGRPTSRTGSGWPGRVNSLGVLHADAQRPLEARAEYERAKEILKPVARDSPEDVSYRRTAGLSQ